MPYSVSKNNIFSIREARRQKWCVLLAFAQHNFEGFFRTPQSFSRHKVGRPTEFKSNAAPVGLPWLWALAYEHYEDRTPTHGYPPGSVKRIATPPAHALRCAYERIRKVLARQMKQALLSSAAAILIAGLFIVSVGWYFSPPRPEPTRPDTVTKIPKLPEGIDVAFRCDGVIIAIIENQLEGVSRGGTYLQDDVERTVWIYNPLRVLEGQPFIFKQYETAHPYSTWSAELNGNPCQAIYFGMSLEDRLPEAMRDLAKIVRLEKSHEFKHCLEENPDEHQMCRDVAEETLK
jgi:hypothetical protein